MEHAHGSNLDLEDALIPCELCDQVVPFSQYMQHIRLCSRRLMAFHVIGGPIAGQTTLTHHDNDEDDDEQDDDESSDDDTTTDNNPSPHDHDPPANASSNNFRIRFIQVFIPMATSYEANMALANSMGNVEVGVDDLDAVTSKIVNTDAATFCPICQDSCGQRDVRRTLCGHDFCEPCIAAWFERHKKCPVCMVDVTEVAPSASNTENRFE